MSIAWITALLLFTLATAVLEKRRASLILLFVTIFTVLIIGTGVLPKFLLDGLQTHPHLSNPRWKANNAIVVLGAGTSRSPTGAVTSHFLASSRLLEAARLYYSCKKQNVTCRIILTGGDPAEHGISEAELMVRGLVELDIAEADILKETKSNNTFQNAQFTSEIIKEQKFDEVFLSTSGIHMARSLVYFEHFGIKAVPSPADRMQATMTPIPIAYNFSFFDSALHEYGGLLKYGIYNFLELNPGSEKPGSL